MYYVLLRLHTCMYLPTVGLYPAGKGTIHPPYHNTCTVYPAFMQNFYFYFCKTLPHFYVLFCSFFHYFVNFFHYFLLISADLRQISCNRKRVTSIMKFIIAAALISVVLCLGLIDAAPAPEPYGSINRGQHFYLRARFFYKGSQFFIKNFI